MDLDLNLDIGQSAAPDDGDRPIPYDTNGAAWHDAFCLLQALRSARGLYMRPGDRTSGDRMVREFARRVRASSSDLILHRILRHIAVSDERLVLCVYGLAVQYGLERDRGLGTACMIAVGFDPQRIRRIAVLLTSCRWAVCYDHYRDGLYCTDWYLNYVSGGAPIDREEVRWFAERVQRLPTAEGHRPESGGDSNAKSHA